MLGRVGLLADVLVFSGCGDDEDEWMRGRDGDGMEGRDHTQGTSARSLCTQCSATICITYVALRYVARCSRLEDVVPSIEVWPSRRTSTQKRTLDEVS